MSLRSMTGYGASVVELSGWRVRVWCKSVNHKSLDVRVQLPRGWGELEPRVLAKARARLARGRVSLHIEAERHTEASGGLGLGVDEARFGQVRAELSALSRSHELGDAVTWETMLSFRHLFLVAQDAAQAPAWEDLEGVVDEALCAFVETREREGAAIAEDLGGHLETLRAGLASVVEMRPALLEGYAGRLQARVTELATREGVIVDPERLAQEAVWMTERADIAEELQRAGAHLVELGALLETCGDEPMGKKLDFYLQEMIRETNTMASKSNFSALTAVVVDMKTAIERMREQAANVE